MDYQYRLGLCLRILGAFAPLREALFIVALLTSLCAAGNGLAQNWDRFRGPNGDGQSDAAAIPLQWAAADAVWKRPLEGLGHSSPVVWGSRVFVTSADAKSADQIVLAFDANSGAPLWEKRLGGGGYAQHAQNSFASSTPAVDADRLYVAWRAGETIWLAAFTHDGSEAWRREIDRSEEKYGFGASPVLVDGVVCLTNDNESASTLTGVDRKSGEIRWQVPRPSAQSAYSTPCLLDSAGKRLLVTTSTAAGLVVFDPATGRTAWQMLEKDLPQRCVSSPIVAGGLILVSCGLVNNGMHLIAVQPGSGDSPPREVYRVKEGVPNVPTPVVAGDLLFLWHDRGIVTCLDLASGHQHWRQRIGGNFNSSPIRVGDRIYCASRSGEMVVLAADKEYKLLSRFDLGGPCNATPAVAGDRMFLRTDSMLMCVGERASANN
jgi:outer membrane protein assembly factor BamB